MSFASLSGARIPHPAVELVTIAVFNLPGGAHSATAATIESVGWSVTAGVPGTINKIGPDAFDEVQHSWLTSVTVPITEAPPEYMLYADALAAGFVIRATTVSATPPATGGTDVWRDLSFTWNWLVNSGGSPGEVVTSTILLEIAQTIANEPGPVLASGEYTMTITRS